MTEGLAADSGWLLVVILALTAIAAVAITVRRTVIEHGGGTVECALRFRDRRWRLGLAAYQRDALSWYPAFGVLLRPRQIFVRRTLSVVSRRPASAAEAASLGPGTMVVECDTGEVPERVELALSEDALTGFLAWLEAAPPGPVSGYR